MKSKPLSFFVSALLSLSLIPTGALAFAAPNEESSSGITASSSAEGNSSSAVGYDENSTETASAISDNEVEGESDAAANENTSSFRQSDEASALATSGETSADAAIASTTTDSTLAASQYVKVYRLYHPIFSEHLYTSDENEAKVLAEQYDWNYEGISWTSPQTGVGIYRLYNPSLSQHLYTTDVSEIAALTAEYGWQLDNNDMPLFYSAQLDDGDVLPGAQPIYRLYNEPLGGMHLYTADESEYASLTNYDWSQEGVAFYCLGDESVDPLTVSAYVNGNEISSQTISGKQYLFLPSCADLTDVTLAFSTNGESVSGAILSNRTTGMSKQVDSNESVNLEQLGFNSTDNTLSLRMTSLDGLAINDLTIMQSANVLTMFIVSNDPENKGRAYVEASPDHSLSADATMILLSPDGTVVYGGSNKAENNAITIKGRGNATWELSDKRPYQIKLNKKTDLLSTADSSNKAKKWLLLANSFDATLLHNSISLDLAAELGLGSTPEYQPVDLIYDGEYRGSYLLTEKVEVNSGRLDENSLDDANEEANPDTDLESLPTATAVNRYGATYQYVEGVNNPEDYTGCYLIEAQYSTTYMKRDTCWFATDPNNNSFDNYSITSPEYCSKEEACYISEFVGEAVECAKNGGVSPTTGKTLEEYFDIDSLAAFYIVQEFCKNSDAGASSTYFYKPAGEDKLYAGPIWDFDNAFGTRIYGEGATNAYAYHGYISSSRGLFSYLLKNQAFRNAVARLYTTTVNPLVTDVLSSGDTTVAGTYMKSMAAYADEVAASQSINQIIFGLLPINQSGVVCNPLSTWTQNITYLTNFAKWRNQWIFKQMTSWLANDGHEVDTSGAVINYDYCRDGIDYSLVFDLDYYLTNNADVAASFGSFEDAFDYHFMRYGMREGRQASANFNVYTYAANNEDLRLAFGDDLEAYYIHYCEYGFSEGRIAI